MTRSSTHIDHVRGAVANFDDRLAVLDTADETLREELAHRATDGIEVTLLWCRCHNTVAVQVSDIGADTQFEVVVPREHALDAFYHPYAYAAQQGLDYELPVLRAA
jgi:hypothetical protein